MGWLGSAYPWVKAFHIIFVIFWMAGLFMLPRYFIYHQETARESAEWDRWVIRERRIIRIILNPAIVMAWALGLALAWNVGAGSQLWFLWKLVPVLLLACYHWWLITYAAALARGEEPVKGKTMRFLNEVPGLAAICIVILAVVRPG